MTSSRYRKLKVGDSVTLAVARPDYSCGHKTPDGRVYVRAGTTGVVGVVKVPAVRVNREFVCVDFDFWPDFADLDGQPADHRQRKDLPPRFRVAAYAEELR